MLHTLLTLLLQLPNTRHPSTPLAQETQDSRTAHLANQDRVLRRCFGDPACRLRRGLLMGSCKRLYRGNVCKPPEANILTFEHTYVHETKIDVHTFVQVGHT
jgi:hypothetical protein